LDFWNLAYHPYAFALLLFLPYSFFIGIQQPVPYTFQIQKIGNSLATRSFFPRSRAGDHVLFFGWRCLAVCAAVSRWLGAGSHISAIPSSYQN